MVPCWLMDGAVAESITSHATTAPSNLPIDPLLCSLVSFSRRPPSVVTRLNRRTDPDRGVRVDEILVVLRDTVAIRSYGAEITNWLGGCHDAYSLWLSCPILTCQPD